ncbi:MAG: YidC/Oxa1 family membrane protein insertase [Patescibacteria group bacterium]
MIVDLYYLVLFEPLFNGLLYIYNYIPSLGVSIIIITVLIKLLLYIPSRSSIRAQKNLQQTQPKMKAIQEKYKNDKEELGRQLMKFYKENKVNPFSSCLPLLLQLPILIALYRVFFSVAQTDPTTGILIAENLEHLYAPLRDIFTSQAIDPTFLGIFDLSQKGNFIFAILAGAAQFWQAKMIQAKKPPRVPGAKDEGMAANLNKQMLYFMPIITVFFGIQFPAGLTLYWLVSTLFMVAQQWYVMKKDSPADGETPAVISK